MCLILFFIFFNSYGFRTHPPSLCLLVCPLHKFSSHFRENINRFSPLLCTPVCTPLLISFVFSFNYHLNLGHELSLLLQLNHSILADFPHLGRDLFFKSHSRGDQMRHRMSELMSKKQSFSIC